MSKRFTLNNQVSVKEVGLHSPLLEEVIKLHAAGKSTLGPFPRGAFEDHACRNLILAAITPNQEVSGYLLYREAKNRATIVHLTTSTSFRGQGIARVLVEALKAKTKHLLGICLRCRRDYNINDMWQGFGFTVRNSKEGRSASGSILDYWWFDHNHEDLFSQAEMRDDAAERALTVIDANVFFDLICPDRPNSEDTRVLQADWLQGNIVLCITKEMFNEIHRSPREEEKRRGRIEAQKFREVKNDEGAIKLLEKELEPLFNGATFANDISDMRHVAHAIAAEAPFLVTRDSPMLARSSAIFERFGLRILHPTDLVNRFDVLRREAEYRPSRLEGSNWRERLATAEDVGTIVERFKHGTAERSRGFEQRVRHYLANPQKWSSCVVAEADKEPSVYVAQSNALGSRLEIGTFRHAEHPLAGTLLRHLLHEIIRDMRESSTRVIYVSDRLLSDEAVGALTELGFIEDEGSWWKLSVKGLVTRDELLAAIRGADMPIGLKERLLGAVLLQQNASDEVVRARLENLFSPAKLISTTTPCFVVSIRQNWAAHFFDIPVGAQTIMDLNERLHLGIEGAYYCSANNRHLKAPGRVLWYVSGTSAMSIRACSHLEEVRVGPPKEVFAQFRHLGIYSWKHVLETAKGNLERPLIAFRFSRTERFHKSVALTELKKLGIPQPQNPRRITDEQFGQVYRLGMKL